MSLLSEWSKTLAGEHHWPVPAYSAVKVAGKKLYQYARGEESVPAPVKPMRFWDIELLNHTDQRASFRLRCSKGSYIRSWVKALGDLSGVGATMEELRRTYSAPFEVESALSLGSLEERGADPEQWGISYVPLNLVLPHLKAVTVRGRDERLLGHGQIAFDLERRLITEVREAQRLSQPVGVRVFSGENGSLLALLEALPGRGLKIKRVFKTTS